MTSTISPSRRIQGFTIVELLIATGIILLTSIAILFGYVQCLELNTLNKDMLTALNSARNITETIKGASFDEIYGTYQQKTFPIQGLDGIVLTQVDNKNPQLLGVSIQCFWRSKGRVIGEDKNLNGSLDKDEDQNNNGKLDSPVTLLTMISKR
jgi:type II secretory pathway pseudopilin PulG